METEITGEEFIETLNLDNFYRLVEISDLQTIRNLCISSQEFNYYCQQERFQTLIQRKVNLLRQEAVLVLINFLKSIIRYKLVIVDFPDEEYSFGGILRNRFIYTLKNKITGHIVTQNLSENEFNEIISSAVNANRTITIKDPYLIAEFFEIPQLSYDFINNIGVQLIPYVQFDEYSHGYIIKIIPQEFIRDYVLKH